jgi:tetratricopeptide (TPR) repeat protein
LATSAAGWLNEGLASYFEGSRILANGTVIMNLPANHRLFPLADRMSKGWMASAKDGIDPNNPSKSEPEKSPTFRIVLENEYAWGPPWYAPTWGVVYFLWNYQDPVDGRFVYRNAFREFINTSGGRIGKGAIQNFEKVVLGNPEPPTPKLDPKLWKQAIALPKDVDELTEVWKSWILDLRDEQSGKVANPKPYLQWARYALQRKDVDAAIEHFEKGILASPGDIDCLTEFAKVLAKETKNPDRAVKLTLQALRAAEAKNPPDEAAIKRCEQLIVQWDPAYMTLEQIQRSLGSAGRSVARRYLAAGLPMMSMDLSWHLAAEMGLKELYDDYDAALKQSGKSLAIWRLAYNEKNLDGWAIPGNTTYQPAGEELASRFGKYGEDEFTFQFLTVDTVTSGDFSMETEVTAEAGKVNFCGLVFGKKSDTTFHAFIYFPPRRTGAASGTGFVDLTTFYGGGQHRIWRHNAVQAERPRAASGGAKPRPRCGIGCAST